MTTPPAGPTRNTRFPLATTRAVTALILREMSTTYGRSPGGYIWAILEPAAGIALLTIIFSTGFRSPSLGTSFPLFYAAGILPFFMYVDISNKLSQTIQFSRALLEYPRVTFVDALLGRFILNAFTQLMVSFVVISFIMIVLDTYTVLDFGKLALAYLMAISLAFGVGVMNSFLILSYPLGQTIWAITTRPLFIISCLFYIFESVPQPYSDFLWFNPLVHIVGTMRDAYYPFYHPTYISTIYVFLLSGALTLTGLLLLRRYHQDILVK